MLKDERNGLMESTGGRSGFTEQRRQKWKRAEDGGLRGDWPVGSHVAEEKNEFGGASCWASPECRVKEVDVAREG